MGLYDGRLGTDGFSSSAHVAVNGDPSVAALGDVETAVRALVDEAGVLLDDVGASC